MCASAGWDYVILDTEHNDFDYETLANCALVAKYEEMSMFVRVPDKLYHQMAQMLDIGAEGLVLPQVKTKVEAEQIIRSTKYAPMGKRGVSISTTHTLFRDIPIEGYTAWANMELMTIVQIESLEGIDNMDQIFSAGGIDAVMIGPADMTSDMGIPGQINHPKVVAAFREVINKCNKYGIAPGIHLNEMEDVKKWVAEGMRFITYSYDSKLFQNVSMESIGRLRNLPTD
jgi:4-hydroxy-2-oxoheptanedioate aldolase